MSLTPFAWKSTGKMGLATVGRWPPAPCPRKLTGREALAEWAWPPGGGGPQLRALGSLREGRHWQNGPGHHEAVAPSMSSASVQACTGDLSRAPPLPYRRSPAVPREHPSVLAAWTVSLTSKFNLPSCEMRPRL